MFAYFFPFLDPVWESNSLENGGKCTIGRSSSSFMAKNGENWWCPKRFDGNFLTVSPISRVLVLFCSCGSWWDDAQQSRRKEREIGLRRTQAQIRDSWLLPRLTKRRYIFFPLSSCFVLEYISVFPHKRVPEPLVTLVKTLKFRTMSRAYWDT